MTQPTDVTDAQSLAIALRPLVGQWKPRSNKELDALTQARTLIDLAIDAAPRAQAPGRISAGDATLRTLTVQIEGEIPEMLRTMGEPVVITHAVAP